MKGSEQTPECGTDRRADDRRRADRAHQGHDRRATERRSGLDRRAAKRD
jgi:hypothetical protein